MGAMTSPGTPVKQTSYGWIKNVEPWYLAYALLGVTMAGLAPILLPLAATRTGGAAHAGLVMAALSFGGLTAPLWGMLADRFRLHRLLLSGGMLITAFGLAVFPFSGSPAAWIWLAFLQGSGAAAAATVANLFVVEVHPRDEWDERIGWLQTFYGAGQVAGLVLAGIMSGIDIHAGLLAGAGLTALAVLPGWLTTKTPALPQVERPVLAHAAARHAEWAAGSPQRHFHYVHVHALKQSCSIVRSSFGLFLVVWFVSFGASSALFSLYPVVMQDAYGVPPDVSSPGFALAAALGLALYSPSGKWSERLGPARVLRAGLCMRAVAFLAMLGLGLFHFTGRGWFALLCVILIVLAWSLLSVSGTELTAQLSPVGEGEGMGIFNAVTAISGMAGAALGGLLAEQWGYVVASGIAAIGVVLGLVITVFMKSEK